jgi:hypothetical protein
LGALLSLAAMSAQAAPQVVTITPSVLGGPAGTFNADGYTINDNATATITNATGAFTETGTLTFANYTLTGAPNGGQLPASTTGVPTSYGLYLTFTASGTLPGYSISGNTPAAVNGSFSNITYTLYGNPGNTNTVTAGGTLNLVGTNTVLATGGLSGGTPNVAAVTASGTPYADVQLSINKTAAGNSYFTLPANLSLQEDQFSNTTQQFTFTNNGTTTTLLITNGGGTGTFIASPTPAPEPASMALLGTGLLGLGFLGKRRRKG